jgi:spore protease
VESSVLVQALSQRLHPVCVIAIDALASRSTQRLCRTVQISTSGIAPGSGVGNHRMALSEETLGIPVISVGVPTVVSGSTLIMDLLGKEDDEGLPGGDLFVTPREIDSRVADLSRVIGYGVSMALNPGLTVEDLDLLLS